jgi:hypothetical protein
MRAGFELSESLVGTFYWLDDPLRTHGVRGTFRLSVDGLRRFVVDRTLELSGVLFAEGLAEQSGAGSCATGSVVWRLIDERRVAYTVSFVGDDGRTYHLRGQRDFFLHDALDSLTTMDATLFDEDRGEVGRARLHFTPSSELTALLRTFRPRLHFRRSRRGR